MKTRDGAIKAGILGVLLALVMGCYAGQLAADDSGALPVVLLPAPGTDEEPEPDSGDGEGGLDFSFPSLGDFLIGTLGQGVAVDNLRHQVLALTRHAVHRVSLVDDSRTSRAFSARPLAIALDPDPGRALVLDALGHMHFLDVESLLSYRPPLWLGPTTGAIAIDENRGLAVVRGGLDSALKIVDMAAGTITGIVQTTSQSREFAVHSGNGALLVLERRWSFLSQPDDRLRIYDIETRELRQVLPLPGRFRRLAVDEQSNLALLAAESGNRLVVLDLVSGQVTASHELASAADQIIPHPAFAMTLLFDQQQDILALLDLGTQTLIPDYQTLPQATSLAVSLRFNRAVINMGGQALALLPLPSPAPELTAISPQQAVPGEEGLLLSLEGSHFVDGARVLFDEEELDSRWLGPQALEADLPDELLLTPGVRHIRVENPVPNGGPSLPLPFTVEALVPEIHAFEPPELLTSNDPESLLVLGKHFVPDARVYAGAVSLATEFLDSERLRARVPPSLLSSPGHLTITVVNPEPGGGLSNAVELEVKGAPPKIHSLSPASGKPGTLLHVRGDFFDALSAAGNRVTVGGAQALVAEASKTELTVVVPLAAETGVVTVTTAAGSAQSPEPFTVLAEEDFAIAPSHSDISVPVGGEGGLVVSLTSLGLTDYAGQVELAAEDLPPGVSVDYSHGRLSLHQSTVINLHHDGSAVPGDYEIRLRATGPVSGGEQVRDITLTLRLLPADATVLNGRVLHAGDDSPFVGARVRLGDQVTTTDGGGRYLFVNPEVEGDQVVIVDGEPGNTDAVHYASRIPMPVMIEPGQTNTALTVFLAAVDTDSYTDIVPGEVASVTAPELPNYELRIPDGVFLTGWDGEHIDRINVRVIPPDRLPVRPLPEGVNTRSVYLYYFFRPGGAEPDEPIPVTMNNDLGLMPGDKATLWYYDESPEVDPESNQWRIMGLGTVSADGQRIVSDPGVGIPRFCCGASAASPVPDDQPRNPPGGDDDGSCAMGNPVDLASGIGSVVEPIDLELPGFFSPRIDIAYSPMSDRNGAFGTGTWLNLDWRLFASGASVTVSTPSGVRYILVQDDDGIYRSRSGRAGGFAMEVTRDGGIATLRFGDGRRYEFATTGDFRTLLLAQEDANGNRITLIREAANSAANGRLVAVRDSRNRRYRLEYVSNTRVGAIVDPVGRRMIFDYDGNRLIRVTDFAGHAMEYSWDQADRIVEKLDATSAVTRYRYNEIGRTISQDLADGGIFRFDYQAVGRTVTGTQVTDPRGHRHQFRFNSQGYPVRSIDPLGRVTEARYDSRTNFMISRRDPLSRLTLFTYDNRGNRTSSRDHRDRTTLVDYHPRFDKPVRIRDPLGRESFFGYTANGDLRSFTNAAGDTFQLSYTGDGLLASATDPLGNSSHFSYDNNGNLIRATDPLGNTERMDYDAAARLTVHTDALGRTTRYQYDELDRLTLIRDARGGETEIRYTPRGHMESVRDPKGALIETNSYDSRGRLVHRRNAGGNQWLYDYDLNGNLTRHTDASGRQTRYDYDPLDRLVHREDADGRVTTYQYDLAGRLVRVTDSHSGETRYHYDDLDRMVRELNDRGMVEYAYDAADQLIERRINGTEITTYSYDPAGRISTITHNGRSAQYQWDRAGRLTGKTLPNGVRQLYSYDNASRLLRIDYFNSNGEELERIDYTYDAAGQRTGRHRHNGFAVGETPFTATYDDDNRMLTYNGHALSYDANGNLTSRETSDGTVTYTWNARNRLIAIAGPYGTAEFAYDHLGRRIERTVNGITTRYLYHGPQAIAELKESAIGAVYHNGLAIDEVLARYSAIEDRTLLTDALGSVIALADADGTIRNRYGYSPYGESETVGEESDNPLGYTGREDDSTGLYYYRERYYDPELKRFISRDPIGLEGGINLYAYTFGNPATWIDPEGTNPAIVSALVGGAMVGGASAYTGTLIAGGSHSDARAAVLGGMLQGVIIGVSGAGGASIVRIGIGTLLGVLGNLVTVGEALSTGLSEDVNCQ